MPLKPYYDHAGIQIFHGDCRNILPQIVADVLLTDPPYGLNDNWHDSSSSGNGKSRLWDSVPEWDSSRIEFDLLSDCINKCRESIVWGGNYYPLTPSGCWLAWDKCQSFGGAEFELAWTNLKKANRIFRLSRIDAYVNCTNEVKMHPAQKPIQLMRWCISHVCAGIVLDAFMGSGTTLLAAKQTGRSAIGIEIEERYCEIAAKRLSQEVFQFDTKDGRHPDNCVGCAEIAKAVDAGLDKYEVFS